MKRKYHHHTDRPIKTKQPHVRALFKRIDDKALTLRQVAERSGVDCSVLSNWRRGMTVPRLDLFVAVCEAIGVTISIQLELELK